MLCFRPVHRRLRARRAIGRRQGRARVGRRVRGARQRGNGGARQGSERRGLGAGDLYHARYRAAQRQGERALARLFQQDRGRGQALRRAEARQGCRALDPAAQARRRGSGAQRCGETRRVDQAHLTAGSSLRRRQVLPERSRFLPQPRSALRNARQEPQLRRADRSLDRLALDRAPDARRLRALCRACQRGRARARIPGSGRDVALQLRHAAGCLRQGSRALVRAGRAALRRAALLRTRPAREEVRQGQGARRQTHPRAPVRQHVGAAVEQDLRGHPAALSGSGESQCRPGAGETRLRRQAHDPVGRAVLRFAGLPQASRHVLGAFHAHAPARSRGGVPRERLADGRQRGRAHQAVHRSRPSRTSA